MYTQVPGKIKLALSPFLNEYWNVAFHLTGRGLATGIIPYKGRLFEIRFDFVDHNLFLETDDGAMKAMPLVARPVADFYVDLMNILRAVGVEVTINTTPSEVPDPINCDLDRTHRSYDPEYVNRWWRLLLQVERVLQQFRSPFTGKSSPIQFFWGSFDLNHTRFSGRGAPAPSGPRFFQLSEDQENFACGFWPGNPNFTGLTVGEPTFYAYIYPKPEGFELASVEPDGAAWDDRLGEFILPYEVVRRAPDPDAKLLAFFESTYASAARLAGWDAGTLERALPRE